MQDRQKAPAFPFRMDKDVRAQAEALAEANDRSLNWQLNELVKMGLAQMAGKKESASTAATVKRSV